MKTVKLLCYQVYKWNRNDFWLINILCFISGLIIYFNDIHPVFEALLVISLLVKVFTYVRGSSVMPALGTDTNQFSWKYMQSLPLNKKEIVAFLVLTNFMSYIPVWVWLLSFQPLLFELFEYKVESIGTLIEIYSFIFVSTLIITPMSLTNLIQFPRQQFSRKNEKAFLYGRLKEVLVVICVLIYIVCGIYYLEAEFDINVFLPFAKLFKLIDVQNLSVDWSLAGLLVEVLILVKITRNVIDIWQEEARSYVKITWEAKRDMPIIMGCLVLITIPFQFNFMGVEEYYRNDPMLKSVYLGKADNIQKLLASDNNIKVVNKFGATVLMAAAENGDLEMFKHLEKLGASRDGILKIKNEPERDIFELALKHKNFSIATYLLNSGYMPKKTALLEAVSKCNTRINDLLMEKGADIHSIDENGKSPLHIASRANCFGTVVSLIEQGADTTLKDKNGKTPEQYLKDKDNDLAYYLNKKSRSPASK